MVSTSELSESDESDSKNFSHGLNSFYMNEKRTPRQPTMRSARHEAQTNTNWRLVGRVIPGGDKGAHSTVVDHQQ